MNKKREVSISKLGISVFYILLKYTRKHALIAMTVCAIVGLSTSANTLVKQLFFDSVEALTIDGRGKEAAMMACFWGVFTLLTLLLHGVSDVLTEDLGIRISGILGKQVNDKVSRLDAICFEDTEMLDTINKVYQGAGHASQVTQVMINLFVFYIPYFLFFAVYAYRIHPILSLGILLVLVPAFVGQRLNTHFYAALEDRSAPVRRKMNYYQSCMADREYLKETRLLGAVWFFKTLYEASVLAFKKEKWKTNCCCAFTELGIRMLSLLVYVIILVLMYRYLKMGYMSVSAFAAILTSVDQMFNSMDYVTYNLGDLSEHLPSMANTLTFLSLPEKISEDVKIEECSIELKNISFLYPGSKTNIIKNVSLKIKAGETIAIVGENGSGKSTLVKLLMGLYVPTEGDIFISDYNTKTISNHAMFENTTAVFQDFQKYKMSVKDNIVISQTDMAPDLSRLHNAAAQAEIDVGDRGFNHGFDTMLSREFDGVDLSGGQWQRVAIGRGLYKKHQLIVLDEPTAAIDPIEETKLYHQFVYLSKGKTAVIVTHRLGSAQIADRIIVLNQGEIDDIGTHEELLQHNGKYAEMYQAQARWYR